MDNLDVCVVCGEPVEKWPGKPDFRYLGTSEDPKPTHKKCFPREEVQKHIDTVRKIPLLKPLFKRLDESLSTEEILDLWVKDILNNSEINEIYRVLNGKISLVDEGKENE
jgi:hypothetical protein